MNKNNLFYLCSLIESISQKTNLLKKEIVNYLKDNGIRHIYEFSDIYHCLPIEQSTDEIIEDYSIPSVETNSKKQLISIWDSGDIYARLILDLVDSDNWIDTLKEVYNSDICQYIDDSSLPIYWQPRSYIKECYLKNKIL